MSTAPNIAAPLSIPLIITKYLVDTLNEGDVGVKWARDHGGPDDWFFATYGVALNTRERTTVGAGSDDDTVDPNIQKLTFRRTIVAAQASGFSLPKWGLDYVRARIFSLTNSTQVPALEAEDMMERIKLALNSIDGREIWRMTHFPLRKPDLNDPLVLEPEPEPLDAIPFNMQRGIRQFRGTATGTTSVADVLSELYRLTDLEEDGSVEVPQPVAPYNIPFEHVANWSSTVLDGNTIQQASSGTTGRGGDSYTAFSIDFTMYIELLHPSVLGFREPFVDRRGLTT